MNKQDAIERWHGIYKPTDGKIRDELWFPIWTKVHSCIYEAVDDEPGLKSEQYIYQEVKKYVEKGVRDPLRTHMQLKFIHFDYVFNYRPV